MELFVLIAGEYYEKPRMLGVFTTKEAAVRESER